VFGLLLLERASSCERPEDIWLDLAVSIREGKPSTLTCVGRFIDINSFDPSDIWEKTPLHIAVEFNQVSIVTLLLEMGADVNSINALDETPLKVAVKHGLNDIAAILLFNGADVENPDSLGRTILFWAISKENASLVNLLLEHNANLMQKVQVSGQEISLRNFATQTQNTLINQLIINRVEK
jgi:ankyrin repeat protein